MLQKPTSPVLGAVDRGGAGRRELPPHGDSDIGKVMDAIRQIAPNTIVIVTADNGAWLDAYPDAGATPFRGEKGSPFEGGWRMPGLMWWPNRDTCRDGRPDPAAARMGGQ